MSEIIAEGLLTFSPKKVLLLFSGGHDSLCSTYYSAQFLKRLGIDFTVYHGNTGIGIEETRQFVRTVCQRYGWALVEGHPFAGHTYEDLVRKHGFPGPASHKFMYRMLKERPLRHYVTHQCKTSSHARENVLLITGIRRSESKIRMGYREYYKKEGSRIWCSPIFFWTQEDIDRFMRENELPRNPVKDTICISGECLCGAFAGKEEWFEINRYFPNVAEEIRRLHKIASDNGHPWNWASNPTEYAKNVVRNNMHMCVGCESKNIS